MNRSRFIIGVTAIWSAVLLTPTLAQRGPVKPLVDAENKRMQPEQVTRGPSERDGLLAPFQQEEAAVLDCLLPALDLNMIGAVPFEQRQDVLKGPRPGRD